MRSYLCTRSSFTLTDGRVLSCVLRPGGEPLYFLGLPHLTRYWWLQGGPQDFGAMIDLDDLPKGLEAIADAMTEPHAYRFHPTVFDPSEPYL
jgi:hypothetical protein